MPFLPHALYNKLMVLVAGFFNYATNFMFTYRYIPLSRMIVPVKKLIKDVTQRYVHVMEHDLVRD
jgi:hypothetical protein